MRKPIVFLLLFMGLVSISGLIAWDWPLSSPVVVKDFAGDGGGVFFPGMVLQSRDEAARVKAMNDGEVIFQRQPGRRSPRVAWGGNSALLVDHVDGLRALYSGVEVDTDLPAKVRKNQDLGAVGTSAFFPDSHLWLVLFDRVQGGVVNPALVCTVLPDDRRPLIHSVSALWPDKAEAVALGNREETTQGSFRLFAWMRDLMPSVSSGSNAEGLPARIRVLLNGKIIFSIDKTALRMLDGRQSLVHTTAGHGSHRQFFGNGGSIDCGVVNLSDGNNRLEIIVADFAGNRSGAMYRIHYRSPLGQATGKSGSGR